MATWAPGDEITAAKLNLAHAFVEDLTIGRTFSSGSFGDASGGAFSTTLTVPASGAVAVEIRATQRNSGANNSITSFNGTGSVSGAVYTANAASAVIVTGTNNISLTMRQHLTGMSPGETLTITIQHRVNTGSGTCDYRSICAEALT